MKRVFVYFISSLFFTTGQILAQTPEALHSCLPEINGWDISSDIEVFNRDNLYERINGAAPLFLENNFQEMTSMVYTQGEDYITIQAYRHATPEDAFGMYASERSSEMTFYHGIGGEAQGDGYGLFFFSGCIYVKIMASNESESISKAMQAIAIGLSGKIDPEANYPVLFRSFPKAGLIPCTETYITQNYIGHEFLKPVYAVNYHFAEKDIQLFVIDGKTTEGAKQILSDYFKFTKQMEDFTEGNLLIKDRYNGNIPVVWKNRYIIGAFSEEGENFPEEIYSFLSQFSGF
jgi:hypothetical protein